MNVAQIYGLLTDAFWQLISTRPAPGSFSAANLGRRPLHVKSFNTTHRAIRPMHHLLVRTFGCVILAVRYLRQPGTKDFCEYYAQNVPFRALMLQHYHI